MSDSPISSQEMPPRTTGGHWRWEPPTAAELEAILPGYTVECLIGRGGMGAVYKGIQNSLERPVAIKILPPGIDQQDASFTERFKNEAKIMGRLLHPAIVAVFDFGRTNAGQLYIVMEYVDGTDISRMVASQGRLKPEHALSIAAHVCDALSAAHAAGIVHRDIKPANVLINRQGQVKVADFGLAKFDEPGQHGITQSGMALGTPDFVAPEALMLGSQVDARADLYAVGIMLYQMLTGQLPRGAFKPPSIQVPGIDPRFDAIVERAIQMDPQERYQSALNIRQDLDEILTTPFVKVSPMVKQGQAEPKRTVVHSQGSKSSTPAWTAPPPARESPKKLNLGAVAALLLVPVVLGGIGWLAFAPAGGSADQMSAEPASDHDENLLTETTQARPQAAAAGSSVPPSSKKDAKPGETIRAAVPSSVNMPSWLAAGRQAGGKIQFFGSGPHGVIEKGRAEEFNDVVELAVRPDGWLVRRADGETHGVGWGRSSVGGTTTAKPFGPFMTRRITHGGVVSMLMANDASFRNLWGGGSQHRPDMAHKDAAAAVNIGNHLITLGLDGEILVAKKWTGEEHRPPEDFFKGARAFSGIEDTYFSAKPGAVVQGWHAGDGTVTNFPAEIRDVIDIRAADKHVMFLTSSGRVFVTDQKGKPLSDEVGQVPGNIPLAIAIRIGRGMAAIQRMDGIWAAWGKSPELIEQTKKIGAALDLGFDYDTQEKSGLMLWVVPPNPFEKGSLAQVAGRSVTPTPSSQTPKPATPTGDVAARMEQIEIQFQTAYERDILAAHKIAVADLDNKYLAAVNRALNAATQKGTLDEALKLREEAQRVRDKGRLPTADLDSVPETLKNLRGTYRASIVQLEQDRETKTKPYYDRRDQLLDAYQKELTQQQRLDDAVLVKSRRDELAASRFQPASGGAAPVVSAAPKPPPPAAIVPTPMAIAPSKSAKIPKGTTKQSVIEWVYNLGGKVEVKVNDKKQGVHALADLPAEPFEVTLVSIGPGLKMDVTDDDFTMLSILPALEDVTAEGDRLKITSLAPLAGLSKLTKIHVQAKDGVAEKEILRLADLKALDSLRVRLSDFSGEGLEALSRLPKLRTLRVHGNGRLSAKGAEAIASLTQLTSVQFPPLDRASQSRFAPIATLPALDSIELDATSPGVELMRFIARLPKLTKLSFANPTDFNGPSFAALKAANGRLVELSFSAGADPKDESIKEIAAALPGLKIFNLDVPISSCTVKGLKELAKLTNLQTLVWCEARDADYAALSGAPGLENLTVRGKGITDAAFAHFLDLPKLKTLKLVSSAATQAAADAFKKDRPGVTVTLSH